MGEDITVALDLLRDRISELLHEQEEYKALLKELSEKLSHYQERCTTAERLVEEKNMILQKLKSGKGFFENGVGYEIKKIHGELKRRLAEFESYPSLMEREQKKLVEACMENERLKMELKMAKEEIMELKSTESEKNAEYYRGQWVELTLELQRTKNALEALQQDRDRLLTDQPSKS